MVSKSKNLVEYPPDKDEGNSADILWVCGFEEVIKSNTNGILSRVVFFLPKHNVWPIVQG